jgi:hypothetical protein
MPTPSPSGLCPLLTSDSNSENLVAMFWWRDIDNLPVFQICLPMVLYSSLLPRPNHRRRTTETFQNNSKILL